jgi:hypothetical protein
MRGNINWIFLVSILECDILKMERFLVTNLSFAKFAVAAPVFIQQGPLIVAY